MLTSIKLTRMVSGVTWERKLSAVMMPCSSGFTNTGSKPYSPRRYIGNSTDECSNAVLTIRLPRRHLAWAVPNTAQLLLSVPPEVK